MTADATAKTQDATEAQEKVSTSPPDELARLSDDVIAALKELRDRTGKKLLMLTGVRVGESAQRDARIALSCGKNGAECGQGWFQETTPEDVADTLAPVLHWRVCLVWDWLIELAMAPEKWGIHFSTGLVAHVYGGDEAVEINARTGCAGCNLASRDVALERLVKMPGWEQLKALLELKPLYAELKRPRNRLRKDGTETRKDGQLVANPCRMGPLTFDARRMGLEKIKSIQARAGVDLINSEEEARILELIAAKTWPRGWSGTEPIASDPFENVRPDGSVERELFAAMTSGST
jgi:DNA sulfur modification protein DndC